LPARSITARLRQAEALSADERRRSSAAAWPVGEFVGARTGKGQGVRPGERMDYPVIRFQPARVAALT